MKNSKKSGSAQPKTADKNKTRRNFGMKQFSGEGPALERSKIVDGGNLEDAQANLINEDSPILAENFVEDSGSQK